LFKRLTSLALWSFSGGFLSALLSLLIPALFIAVNFENDFTVKKLFFLTTFEELVKFIIIAFLIKQLLKMDPRIWLIPYTTLFFALGFFFFESFLILSRLSLSNIIWLNISQLFIIHFFTVFLASTGFWLIYQKKIFFLFPAVILLFSALFFHFGYNLSLIN